MSGLKTCCYAARSRQLNLSGLALQHLHIDLIMCYEIIFYLVDEKVDEFFQYSSVVTRPSVKIVQRVQ